MTIDEERRLLSELRDRIIAGEEGAWDELLDLGEIRNRILKAVKEFNEDMFTLTDLYLSLRGDGSFKAFRKVELRSAKQLGSWLAMRARRYIVRSALERANEIRENERPLKEDDYDKTAIGPEQAVIQAETQAETRRALQALMAQLSERCQIILMKDDMKKSAETLGMTYNAVRQQRSRNIRHLKQIIKENGIQL